MSEIVEDEVRAAPAPVPAADEVDEVEESLVEEVTIDGMCGVY
jgi:mycofactocin precursor